MTYRNPPTPNEIAKMETKGYRYLHKPPLFVHCFIRGDIPPTLFINSGMLLTNKDLKNPIGKDS
jgi:hypothetical protein